jgi:hypothetical protein
VAFKDGIDTITEYLDTRADQIKEGKRITWSNLHTKLDKFSRETENGQYQTLQSKDGLINKMDLAVLRTKVNALCAFYRDLRVQFYGMDSNHKVPNDSYRQQASWYKWLASTFFKQVLYRLGVK